MVSTIQLSYRDVLGDGVAYLETHGIFHLFLDTLTVGDDQEGVGTDENNDYDNNGESTDSTLALNFYGLINNVFFFGKMDADFRFVYQIGADIFQNVLCGDCAAESLFVDSDRWPVKGAIVFPCLCVGL